MRNLSAGRFIIVGTIGAFVISFVVFIAISSLYPHFLTPDDIKSLTNNGKTVSEESVRFGLMPAFWIVIALLAYVGDGYIKRRRPPDHKTTT